MWLPSRGSLINQWNRPSPLIDNDILNGISSQLNYKIYSNIWNISHLYYSKAYRPRFSNWLHEIKSMNKIFINLKVFNKLRSLINSSGHETILPVIRQSRDHHVQQFRCIPAIGQHYSNKSEYSINFISIYIQCDYTSVSCDHVKHPPLLLFICK